MKGAGGRKGDSKRLTKGFRVFRRDLRGRGPHGDPEKHASFGLTRR